MKQVQLNKHASGHYRCRFSSLNLSYFSFKSSVFLNLCSDSKQKARAEKTSIVNTKKMRKKHSIFPSFLLYVIQQWSANHMRKYARLASACRLPTSSISPLGFELEFCFHWARACEIFCDWKSHRVTSKQSLIFSDDDALVVSKLQAYYNFQ